MKGWDHTQRRGVNEEIHLNFWWFWVALTICGSAFSWRTMLLEKFPCHFHFIAYHNDVNISSKTCGLNPDSHEVNKKWSKVNDYWMVCSFCLCQATMYAIWCLNRATYIIHTKVTLLHCFLALHHFAFGHKLHCLLPSLYSHHNVLMFFNLELKMEF